MILFTEKDGRNWKESSSEEENVWNLYLGTGWYNLTQTRANTKKPHIHASEARGHTKVLHGVVIDDARDDWLLLHGVIIIIICTG